MITVVVGSALIHLELMTSNYKNRYPAKLANTLRLALVIIDRELIVKDCLNF